MAKNNGGRGPDSDFDEMAPNLDNPRVLFERLYIGYLRTQKFSLCIIYDVFLRKQ